MRPGLLEGITLILLFQSILADGDTDSSSKISESKLFTVILVLSFMVAIQLILCVVFGYKGCLAKFKPKPPPYSPPTNPVDQLIAGELELPPAYAESDNNETESDNSERIEISDLSASSSLGDTSCSSAEASSQGAGVTESETESSEQVMAPCQGEAAWAIEVETRITDAERQIEIDVDGVSRTTVDDVGLSNSAFGHGSREVTRITM